MDGSVVVRELQAEFWTDDDDKDRDDAISEQYTWNGRVIAENRSWGKGLVYRNHSQNLGQAFNVESIGLTISDVRDVKYRYVMDNDDGWHVLFKIKARAVDATEYLLSNERREIANGNPKSGSISLRLVR
jgi:hypothetical protein